MKYFKKTLHNPTTILFQARTSFLKKIGHESSSSFVLFIGIEVSNDRSEENSLSYISVSSY